jgi:hypothetical protein
MQMIRLFLFATLAVLVLSANAQVQQARGKATVIYQGEAASVDDKARATQAAQLKAVEFYYAEAGQSEAENFDAVRDKVLADSDRYILETTVLAEEDSPGSKQYTVTVRVALNVANLRNLIKSNSAVANVAPAAKSPLAFVFVSRQVASVKSFDDRVFKRVDEAVKGSASEATSQKGIEGESVRGGQVSTSASTSIQTDDVSSSSHTIETGGSTVRRASETTYRLIPSASLNQIFSTVFTRAGFNVADAAFIENDQFKVANVEADYQAGSDLKSATLRAIASAMREARVPYVALGTLDVGAAGKDPATGLVRVPVTVNAKIFDVTQPIPATKASVGPVGYAGIGPSEDEARGAALKLAADNAARVLASQITAQRVQ